MLTTRSFQNVKPKAVTVSTETLVRIEAGAGRQLPLVLRPGVAGVNLVDWTTTHAQIIEALLAQYGALLFRDFSLGGIAQFEGCARALIPDLIEYGERSSPRTRLSAGIYSSTDHPPDQPIVLHNEQSYTLNWPMKLWFFCAQPPEAGGRTPIADSRKIYQRLAGDVVVRFTRKQVLYVRNYGAGLGLPWQEVFQTNHQLEVARQCRRAGIELSWKSGGRLQTRQVRPAVRKHPRTGEMVWFNHAYFFHPSSLQQSAREAMLAVVDEEEIPFNTFYGDGSPIEPSVLDEIRRAYEDETVCFPWQQHDLLLLDNMLVSHGRESYRGRRKIVVAMGQPRDASNELASRSRQ
jgi:alpha-ketoglutarate-dependent taurine dioxygenase